MKRILLLLIIIQQAYSQTNIAVPNFSSTTNTFNPATGNIKFYLNGVSQTLSVGHGVNGVCFSGNNMFVAYDDNAASGHGILWYKNVSFSSGTFTSDAPVILVNNQQTFQVVADANGNIYSANMDGTITKFMPNAGVYSSANKVTVRFFSNGSYVLGGLMFDNVSNTLWAASYSLNSLAVCRLSDFPTSTSYVTTSSPAAFIKPVTVSANYLQSPEGVVRDLSGNVWISNNNNNYVVRINSAPVVTILSEINAANYTTKSLTGGTDANTWAISANGQQLGGMVYDDFYSKKIYVNNQVNGGNTFQYEFLPTNSAPTFTNTTFSQVFPGNGQSAIIPCSLLPTPVNPTANSTTINSGHTANLTASNCAADQTYLWKQGATQMATTPNFTTPTLTSNTTYHVYCVRGGTCQSSGTGVTVTVNGGGGISQNATISVITPTTTGSARTDSRTFRFHLPSANPDCNLPVLMVFHGDGGTGAGIETTTGFSPLADANNFIAVYPDKLSGQSYFSYRIDQPAYLNGQVDSTFMLAIINYLHANYGINKNRVYATGISSGANMTYFASAKLFNSFAAFAPVAGFPQDYSGTDVWQNIINHVNTPKVPLMHVHGTADVTSGTQFAGTNLPNPYPSTPPSLNNQWIWPMFTLSDKGCNNEPGNFTGTYFTSGNTTVDKLTFCNSGGSNKELSMMIIRGMGHTWPTIAQTGGIDGSLAIWNFVKDYQLSTFSNPAPNVLPGAITINAGQSTILTATCTSGYGVKWNTGATTTAISVSPLSTTTYTAYCTYGINCQSAGTSSTVTVNNGGDCVEDLIVSGDDYPSNTISGIVTLSASNSVKTVLNTVASSDPSYIRTSIAGTAGITFQAGKYIMLNPGFQTNTGAVFTAQMGGCTNGTGVPYLTVQGAKIKNKCGTDFVMRGVNFGGYWQYDINNRINTLNRIKEIKKSGTNTVRLPWSANTEYSRDYKVLDTLIKHIVASKMIAMVELHDLTCADLTSANIQIATNYWTSANILAVLKKYENYLILNIANEVGSDWQGNTPAVVQKMIDAYTPSITALRNAGLKCPITIDATDCGQNIEALVSAAPTLLANDPDHNVIFSAHLYWNNDNYTTRLTNAANNASLAGICLIIGEFSVAQDCPLDATPNDYVAIMQVCNLKGIGYLAWEWGGSQQYGGSGNICPDDSRGVGYSRLTMTGLSGLYADRAGWGLTVANDIQATSVESCQFNP